MGLLSQAQAARVSRTIRRIGHGKFQGLASRGLLAYGYGQQGVKAIYAHNWMKLLEPSWEGTTTTTECMTMGTRGWHDESHPDAAIAYQFSAYILGVVPLEPGFRRFQVRPLPVQEVTWAKGRVPTPHGIIEAGWEKMEAALRLRLTVP